MRVFIHPWFVIFFPLLCIGFNFYLKNVGISLPLLTIVFNALWHRYGYFCNTINPCIPNSIKCNMYVGMFYFYFGFHISSSLACLRFLGIDMFHALFPSKAFETDVLKV
jgi:hypothetical protein